MSATTTASSDSKQLIIIISSAMLMIISFVGISLRLYARLAIIGKVFTEDVLVILGTITAFGLSATFITAVYSGFGKHSTEIQPEDAELLRTLGFIILLLYVLTAILTKTSFLTLYLRLDQRQPMRITVYFLMCCVATVKITFMVIQAFTCTHPTLFWTRNEAQCWSPQSVQNLYNIASVLTIVVAAAIISAPLPMLHGLELPNRQRYIVCGFFALGFLPIIAGCFRCYYLWDLMKSEDINYDAVEAGIWAQVELHMVILCSSASTFKILMKDPSSFLSSCQTNHNNNNKSLDPFPELRDQNQNPNQTQTLNDTSWFRDSHYDDDEKISYPITRAQLLRYSDEHDFSSNKKPPKVVLHRATLSRDSDARVLLRFPSISDRLGSGHWGGNEFGGRKEGEVVLPSRRRVDGQEWGYF